MPKILPPEVLALIPNGIENFVPRCIVCGSNVPLSRARSRSRDTCSPPCATVKQIYRRWLLQTTKCIACYHPSTPAERDDFRQWRKERRGARKKGRPKGKKILDNSTVESSTP
jgi:hypothetical protein